MEIMQGVCEDMQGLGFMGNSSKVMGRYKRLCRRPTGRGAGFGAYGL